MNNTHYMRKLADILKESDEAYNVDDFTEAYMQAMLWAETDQSDEQGGEPLEYNYEPSDFSDEALARIKQDCAQFQEQAQLQSTTHGDRASRMAGHDFWLTRVGHGAGFWDGDWPEPEATRYTELSKKFGHVDVYVGDDGQLELM